ncbi:hypothetical protein ACFPVX_07295 [Cohnella faecalis]|uniref:Uncharacterized protein n=1 Tax=Cohnella faecalis TaxID=2315694 RepID=A0A398CE88_9BACL|nr:hypothetical protein [Cohnella faecalis]RIE00755.1 hypothetical protein D3H35_26545 [Cohnella faecalis]
MDLVDVSNVSPALFVTGALFIMLIGSLLSLGVLRMFQQKKKPGIVMFVLAIVSFAVFVGVIDTWFIE